MTDPARPPAHDPLTCGLHGYDWRAEPKVYCPGCAADGQWRKELTAGRAAPPPAREDDRRDWKGRR